MTQSEQIAAMVQVNDGLFALPQYQSDERIHDMVDSWHSSALYWEQLADAAAQDSAKLSAWQQTGRKIAQNAREIADLANDATLSARAAAFLASFPTSLSTVVTDAVQGVGHVAETVADTAGDVLGSASLGVAKPLIILGVVAAGLIYLLTRSGLKVRAGVVSAG
ncbi:hypothetical protein [Anaeromyxobacter paludicola]|uniref:Uncharacterized protein n=1 Tax=Anaeromyxobacter paludicola TaxID=2918171 RepID=A0ABM7X739_9BACT|nr:hypothetical protein [Anaeromyxobacter paludicola]BDG07606.1 hypothetical protein AMPC_07190 [Anaeromyxobacter paludicola]